MILFDCDKHEGWANPDNLSEPMLAVYEP